MKLVWFQIDKGEFFIRNLASYSVPAVVQTAGHFQSLGRCRPGDQPHHRLVIAQWFAAPVGRDEGKQPVFHLVPFACARGEMIDRQCQPRLVGQTL